MSNSTAPEEDPHKSGTLLFAIQATADATVYRNGQLVETDEDA